ncbi:hypothetical protein SNEBB_002233 [Seison nebaliae]|nr:hypothetical protein SNEBB_002233 [Seison nebaliae]
MKNELSVNVAFRFRPQNRREKSSGLIHFDYDESSNEVTLGEKIFKCDYYFPLNTHQNEVYEECIKEMVETALEGFNITILAYGQTGSGKTYTMGTSLEGDDDDIIRIDEKTGIIPRAILQLFSRIEKIKNEAISSFQSEPNVQIGCSFLELYNESINDLFEPKTNRPKSSSNEKFQIYTDKETNEIKVKGLTTMIVDKMNDVYQLLISGSSNRSTGSTNMNDESSRSHAIFTMNLKLEVWKKSETTGEMEKNIIRSKLNFVDLAGSERLDRTGATGQRAKEGISINYGLLILGNVIANLSSNDLSKKKNCHIPYRDSKLTRLLQDSLGGNAKTLMLACVSPSDCDFLETISTLTYASGARNIRNQAKINVLEQLSPSEMVKQLKMLRADNALLRQQLVETKSEISAPHGFRQSIISSTRKSKKNEEKSNFHMLSTGNLRERDEKNKELLEAERSISQLNGEIAHLKNEMTSLRLRLRANNSVNNNLKIRLGYLAAELATYSPDSSLLKNENLEYELDSLPVVPEWLNDLNRENKEGGQPNCNLPSVVYQNELLRAKIFQMEEEAKVKELEQMNEEDRKLEDNLESILAYERKAMEKMKNKLENYEKKKMMIRESDEMKMEDGEDDGGDADDDLTDHEEIESTDIDESESEDHDETMSPINENQEERELIETDLRRLETDIKEKMETIDRLQEAQRQTRLLKMKYENEVQLLHFHIEEMETKKDAKIEEVNRSNSNKKDKSKEIQRVREQYKNEIKVLKEKIEMYNEKKLASQREMNSAKAAQRELEKKREELLNLKKLHVKLSKQLTDLEKKQHRDNLANTKQLNQANKENWKKLLKIKKLEQEKVGSQQQMKNLKLKYETLKKSQKKIQFQSARPMRRQIGSTKLPSRQMTCRRKRQEEIKNHKIVFEKFLTILKTEVSKQQAQKELESQYNRYLQQRDNLVSELEKMGENKPQLVSNRSLYSSEEDSSEQIQSGIVYYQQLISETQRRIVEFEEEIYINKMRMSKNVRGCLRIEKILRERFDASTKFTVDFVQAISKFHEQLDEKGQIMLLWKVLEQLVLVSVLYDELRLLWVSNEENCERKNNVIQEDQMDIDDLLNKTLNEAEIETSNIRSNDAFQHIDISEDQKGKQIFVTSMTCLDSQDHSVIFYTTLAFSLWYLEFFGKKVVSRKCLSESFCNVCVNEDDVEDFSCFQLKFYQSLDLLVGLSKSIAYLWKVDEKKNCTILKYISSSCLIINNVSQFPLHKRFRRMSQFYDVAVSRNTKKILLVNRHKAAFVVSLDRFEKGTMKLSFKNDRLDLIVKRLMIRSLDDGRLGEILFAISNDMALVGNVLSISDASAIAKMNLESLYELPDSKNDSIIDFLTDFVGCSRLSMSINRFSADLPINVYVLMKSLKLVLIEVRVLDTSMIIQEKLWEVDLLGRISHLSGLSSPMFMFLSNNCKIFIFYQFGELMAFNTIDWSLSSFERYECLRDEDEHKFNQVRVTGNAVKTLVAFTKCCNVLYVNKF